MHRNRQILHPQKQFSSNLRIFHLKTSKILTKLQFKLFSHLFLHTFLCSYCYNLFFKLHNFHPLQTILFIYLKIFVCFKKIIKTCELCSDFSVLFPHFFSNFCAGGFVNKPNFFKCSKSAYEQFFFPQIISVCAHLVLSLFFRVFGFYFLIVEVFFLVYKYFFPFNSIDGKT